jgi:hypothetical protein
LWILRRIFADDGPAVYLATVISSPASDAGRRACRPNRALS